ncbi:MAG: hypothetical protein JST09_03485 [Bacteroidetes bacterium]|nr:hypothetical protein [Bacteroidota bacterium]
MKLSTLKLSSAVIGGLYNKTLVTTSEDILIKQKTNPVNQAGENSDIDPVKEKIKFLGENRMHILVAVNNNNVSFLPENELLLLTNMLNACKLTLADVAIINLATINDHSYKTIFEHFNSNIILLFGTDPSLFHLPVSFPHFQVQSFNNYTFLFTPALGEIQNDKILKSKLWVCLQRIFNL